MHAHSYHRFIALFSIVACGIFAVPTAHADPPTTASLPEPLSAFFETLEVVETSKTSDKARIAWWGDSAIVSDGYTGHLRRLLQQRFGDGGPGFVHVSPTFKGYWHQKVKTWRFGWRARSALLGGRGGRFGYGGVTANGFAGAHSTFETKGAPFDGTVEVLYGAGKRGGNIAIHTAKRGKPAYHLSTRRETPSDGLLRWTLPEPTSWLRVRAGGGGAIRVYGVILEQKGPGLVLDTLGVLGLRGRRLLKNDAAHHVGQIRLRHPNLLVLAFGGNERVDGMSEKHHRDGMVELMKRLQSGAPKASCLFVAPIPHGKRKRGRIVMDWRLPKIFAAQADAAKALGCAYLNPGTLFGDDLDAVMAKFKKDRWIGGDLAHLTRTGHSKVGEALSRWLLGRYDVWKTARVQASASAPSAGSVPSGPDSASDKVPSDSE